MNQNQTSQEYQRMKVRVFFVRFFLDIAVLLIFFFAGLSYVLKEFAGQYVASPFSVNSIYLLIFSIGLYCIHFPLNVFIGFHWEHRFQLSNQSFGAWLKDDLKKSCLGLAIVLLIVHVMYALLSRYPQHWWIGVGIFWLLLSFLLAKLTPTVIIPQFFKYTDIDNQSLREKILELFRTCQVKLKDVYAINFSSKSKKANAFVCGFGSNRRVVLTDTLIANFSDEEIASVVAHELGHYKHRDITKLLVMNSLFTFFGLYLVSKFLYYALDGFGLQRLDDIAFLPMIALALIAYGLITTPLLNAFSCFIEREADRFSIENTKSPKDFISMMQKLGEMNLAEFRPNRFVEIFFYDHPPIYKRIEFAKSFQ